MRKMCKYVEITKIMRNRARQIGGMQNKIVPAVTESSRCENVLWIKTVPDLRPDSVPMILS